MSICVCAKCKQPWKASGSPARCWYCSQMSFAIAVANSQVTSTVMKEHWQNSDYQERQTATHTVKHLTAETRAKISAAHIGKHPTAEHRAKLSASAKKRWQDPEYRDKQTIFLKKRR